MKHGSHSITRTFFLTFSSCFISACLNDRAGADFSYSAAGGYGAQISVSVVGSETVNVTSGSISASGKSDFNESSGLVNLNINEFEGIPSVTTLTIANATGVATSQALGIFSPNPIENISSGEGGVTGLNLGIGRLSTAITPGYFAVSISASALNSSSSIAGEIAGASMEGISTFADLNISVLGAPVNLAVLPGAVVDANLISFAPNTFVALSALGTGARLYLNEQIKSKDQFGNFSITTNALRLDLDAVQLAPGVGVLSSDVVLGNSFAIAAVPEPGSILAICVAGASMIGFRCRKKRNAVIEDRVDLQTS